MYIHACIAVCCGLKFRLDSRGGDCLLLFADYGEHVTPIGLVPGWRIGKGRPCMDGRREIKYLPRSNMHAASLLIVSGTASDNKYNSQIVEENWPSSPDYDWILEFMDITRRRCANTSKLALSA